MIIKRKDHEEIDPNIFGKKAGLTTKLFACWHGKVTRPFVAGKTAYQSCLYCGARKPFSQETLTSFGSFYYPPAIKTGIE